MLGGALSDVLNVIVDPNKINWFALGLTGPQTNLADVAIYAGIILFVLEAFRRPPTQTPPSEHVTQISPPSTPPAAAPDKGTNLKSILVLIGLGSLAALAARLWPSEAVRAGFGSVELFVICGLIATGLGPLWPAMRGIQPVRRALEAAA